MHQTASGLGNTNEQKKHRSGQVALPAPESDGMDEAPAEGDRIDARSSVELMLDSDAKERWVNDIDPSESSESTR